MTFKLDDAELQRTFQRLSAVGARLRPLMLAIGEVLRESTLARFNAGVSPTGVPWVPGHKSSGKTLIGRGTLRDTIFVRADDSSVEIGSAQVYARIHQEGGVIKPASKMFLRFVLGGRIVFARQVTIPARPFLGISAQDQIDVAERADDYLELVARG